MECIVDYTDTNFMYGALYYGDVRRSRNNGRNFYRIAANGRNGITESGAWITPYVLDNTNPAIMYIGYRNLWRSNDVKTGGSGSISWSAISNNLAGSNSNTIRVIEQSPANSNIMYFSRADDKLFRSDNITSGAPTYTDLTTGLPTAQWPVDIEAHPVDPDKVWIAQSNRVFQSINKGVSWLDISGSLPNVSVNCIVYDESSSGDLYVGTDVGVFYKGANMLDWVEFNGSLPKSVEVTELEIYYHTDRSKSRLKAATYGRGLWASELYQEPVAAFSGELLSVCVDQPIRFIDESNGSYSVLKWNFPGATPATSTDRFPVVRYNAPGTYAVSLEVSNGFDSDTLVKTAYITVGPRAIQLSPADTTIQQGDSVELVASGGVSYFWGPPATIVSTNGASAVVKPTTSTVYYVHGGNGGPCDTARSTVNVPPVGMMENNGFSAVRFYPNPAQSHLSIDWTASNLMMTKVVLTDVNGKTLISKELDHQQSDRKYTVSLEGVAKGLLLLRLTSTTGEVVHKIVHQ
jgi:PKD repeat protein